MSLKKLMTRTLPIGLVAAERFGTGVLVGCTGGNGAGERREPGHVKADQEVSKRGTRDVGSEHAVAEQCAEGSGGEKGCGANQIGPTTPIGLAPG